MNKSQFVDKCIDSIRELQDEVTRQIDQLDRRDDKTKKDLEFYSLLTIMAGILESTLSLFYDADFDEQPPKKRRAQVVDIVRCRERLKQPPKGEQ